MKDILVLHHSADFDGICSREVARKALGDTADYLGYDYGQPVPDISGYSTVYLIDISLPTDVMLAKAAKLIVIDHHKTLIDAVEWFKSEFKGYYCIDGVAACRLAYQYFHRSAGHAMSIGHWQCVPSKQDYLDHKVVEPYAVRLLGEYDVWLKSDQNTDPFQLGLLAQKEPDWYLLLQLGDEAGAGAEHISTQYLCNIIDSGLTIQRFTEVTNADISKTRGFDVEFEGLKFRALNTARCNSLTFTAALRPEHDGCLGYYYNGRHWKVSFYGVPHKPDVDLSVIAKKYGGGGHRQACGCEFDELPVFLGGGQVLKATVEETKNESGT
jgi:hypothetical protein